MTQFFHPCNGEWWPSHADLQSGLKTGYLTPNGKHNLACKHSRCIAKRIKWYKEAIGPPSKYASWYGQIAEGTISPNGYSTEPGACNCKACKNKRKRWVREYLLHQKEVMTPVALMRGTRQRLNWTDLLSKSFYYQCTTCGADHTAGVPLQLWAGDTPVWLGPRRKRLALYPLYANDAANVAAFVKRPTPTLTCTCRGVWFEWTPPLRTTVPLVPKSPCPRRAVAVYWWALQALLCRKSPKPVKRQPRDLTQSVSTFYTLEALRAEPVLNIMAQRTIAAQRIVEELGVLRADFVEGLAKDILKYLEFAVCSELRHTRSNPNDWQSTVHYDCLAMGPRCPQCEWLYKFCKGDWRDDYNEIVHKYTGEPSEWWAYADHVFHDVYWEKGFGGKAWGTITTAALDYVTGKSTPAQFVDRAFNLQHNGGLCFDKNNSLVTYGKGDIMRLLDIKRKAQGIWELTPLLHHLPVEYTPVAERALTLLTIQGRRYGAKA